MANRTRKHHRKTFNITEKMKNKELKTIWKLARFFLVCGTAFWLLETFIFLIVEGWHYKATNPIEVYCDKIVSNMWKYALNTTIIVCVYFILNINKKY